MNTTTLSVLVEDKPGVLTRVAGLFARRGFNIDSLAVGTTEVPGLSRMTIVVDSETQSLEQVTKQLNKLVHVLKIVELDGDGGSVERELALIKVAADGSNRGEIMDVVQVFRASVVDVDSDALTLEATGSADKIEAIIRLLSPYGIRELVRSGRIGLGRGARSVSEGRALRLERSA